MKGIVISILGFTLLATLEITAKPDSIGLKEKNGQLFILHQVEEGQTLFAISKKYEVNVDSLKATNPQAQEGLTIGEVILVPYHKKERQASHKTHQVKKGETLFSIAQQYGAEVKTLKEWNDMKSNAIEVGQELIVGQKSGSQQPTIQKPDQEEPKPEGGQEETSPGSLAPDQDKMARSNTSQKVAAKADTLSSDSSNGAPIMTQNEDNTYREKYSKVTSVESGDNGWKVVKEQGKATWIDDELMNNRKSLALHRTAEPGTIIRIKNMMNDKVVFVKTVGNLNEKEDEQTLITISKKAAKKLNVQQDYFRVQLEYSLKAREEE